MKIKSSTTICCVKTKNNKIMIGGDRRVSYGEDKYFTMVTPKVLKRNGFVFGGTGDGEMCEYIMNKIQLPEPPDYMSNFDFMYDVFYPELKRCFVQKDWANTENQLTLPPYSYCEICVGIRGELWLVFISNEKEDNLNGRINLHRWVTPYATGCGGDAALGSLQSTDGSKLTDKQRVTLAIKAAAENVLGADDNVDIVEE